MSCSICNHASEHGHWGQSGTHCPRCHRSWTSTSQAHCTRCCAHFAGPTLFDAHLTAHGCEEPSTVTRRQSGEPRFRQDETDMWRDSRRRHDFLSGPDESAASAVQVSEDPTGQMEAFTPLLQEERETA